jgi:hypothetical protein
VTYIDLSDLHQVIFVNMFTFDKTSATHRKAVQNIFNSLFEEGKKRGYSKYRSHVNTMGKCAIRGRIK